MLHKMDLKEIIPFNIIKPVVFLSTEIMSA